MKYKIYLASPLFTEYERERVKEVASWLRQCGFEVYVPMEHSIPNSWDMSNDEWASAVFAEDIKAINECDELCCIYYGLYSDSGTAWECGYAYGIGKKVWLVNESGTETSLMVIQSACNRKSFVDDVNQT